MCEPVLPNDRFRVSTDLRVQFAPMVFPVMQRFTAYIHYFFVPNRLLWDKWEDFITGGEDGLQEPDYPVITMDSSFRTNVEEEPESYGIMGHRSLFDYLGFPSIAEADVEQGQIDHEFDALPFKAYQLIYNEWYRDQNLSPEVPIHPELSGKQVDSSLDNPVEWTYQLLRLRKRAWKKDYFTSALKDPQRGPDVTLPIAGDMDIKFKELDAYLDPDWPGTKIVSASGAAIPDGRNALDVSPSESGSDEGNLGSVVSSSEGRIYSVDNSKNLLGDGSSLRSATINEVRRAFAVQRWYELAARAGSRYIEQIFAHFGIRSSDARLQRPEYLGGSVVPVFVGDIMQTSATQSGQTPLGTPAGVAQAAGRVKPVTRTFEEHGWLIGILSIIPQASYFQGIPRKFLKRDKFDFAWPLLANLGEQEIQKQELYFDVALSPALNKEGFGYAPRYAEYKFGQGEVHGDFRGSLKDFHDARIFSSRPALNRTFIEVDPNGFNLNSGLNRIFAVRSGMTDHLWVYLFNNIRVRRVLPKYGTPI